MPTGETLLRTAYFLELVGYQVTELHAIPPELYQTGQCIVCNLIPVKTVLDKLAVKKAKRLYEYFRGQVGLSEKRLQILREVAAQHAAMLPEIWDERQRELASTPYTRHSCTE